MKLAYLASGSVYSDAANAIQVVRMCEAFRAETVETVIVSPRKRNERAPEFGQPAAMRMHVPVRQVLSPGVRCGGIIYGAQLAGYLVAVRPDVVYGRNLTGCSICARLGLPVFYEAHMPPEARGERMERRFRRLVQSKQLRGVVAISHALEEALLCAYPTLKGRTLVAHDGAQAVSTAERPVTEREGRTTFGYAGSLYPGKGMEMICKLAGLCPWANFSVAGGTAADLSMWRQRLAGLDNVFFHGRLSHSDIPQFLAGCDGLLAPYQTTVHTHGGGPDISAWMSPLKIFEYMASGRPIIASDLPVLREVLRHQDNAILVPSASAEQWASALTMLAKDSQMCERIALSALNDVTESYTWAARAKNIVHWIGNQLAHGA